MGWSSGTHVMESIIQSMKKVVPDAKLRRRIYEEAIVPALQDADWDCEHECMGNDPAYDTLMRHLGLDPDGN